MSKSLDAFRTLPVVDWKHDSPGYWSAHLKALDGSFYDLTVRFVPDIEGWQMNLICGGVNIAVIEAESRAAAMRAALRALRTAIRLREP